jgi:pre-mRNA-splicing factor SYF1
VLFTWNLELTKCVKSVDTGSEDTFREMLRIKRAVQASFNTEGSFIAAQAAAAKKGTEKPTDAAASAAKEAQDPMAAMEREAMANGNGKKGGGPAFVASTLGGGAKVGGGAEVDVDVDGGGVANPDAIEMDEDEF